LIFEKLMEFEQNFEALSFGEMIYSCMRVLRPGDDVVLKKSEFLNISDRDLYSALCKVYQKEIDLDLKTNSDE